MAIIVITVISWQAGIISVAACVIVFWAIAFFDKKLIAQIQKVNASEHSIASTLHDYINNIMTVITLRLEKLSKEKVVHKNSAKYLPYNEMVITNEVKWFTVSMLLSFISFLGMGFYVWKEITGGQVIMLGTVVILFQYIQELNAAFFNLAWQYEMVVRYNTDIKTINPILQAYAKLKQEKNGNNLKHWQKIVIRNLNFAFNDEEHIKERLVNINLELQRGKKIALIGESGSGKSTILFLLRGLHEPDEFELEIDNKKHSNFRIIGNQTTLVPQVSEIFNNTIEYNITAGVKHRPEEVKIAAELVGFSQIAEKLPQGYQTHMQEKGVTLSGGERQRLALARGIFAAFDSSLILLDEPTSSVDPINEQEIYKNIFTYFAGRCILSSIHKMHLLKMFDWIYVMQAGRIVEQGNWKSLFENSRGYFREIYAKYA